MTIRVRVAQPQQSEVGFVCSPALEAILSLSVLVQPSHHPLHHEWARTTRRQLPPEMKQGLADFRFGHMDYIPAELVPASAEAPLDFADDLERIRALPLAAKSRAILRNLAGFPTQEWPERDDTTARERLRARARERGSSTARLVDLGLERPAELVDGFLDFLNLYWSLSFGEVWAETYPRLIETIATARERVQTGGLESMLETLRPRIGVDRTLNEFWIRRAHDERIELAPSAELLFVPSAFLWPHIGLVRDGDARLAVLYPAPFAAFDSPAQPGTENLVAILKALGDPTRLQVLRLVVERPRSTQELSHLIGLSEPAMSKQLRRLSEAGLVRGERDGYYRLYSAVREQIEPLSAQLLEYLEGD